VLEQAGITDFASVSLSVTVAIVEAATIADLVKARFLWEPVDDSQSGTWTPVDDTQGGAWTPVAAAPAETWTSVAPAPAGAWTPVDDTQTGPPWTPVDKT